MQEYIAQDEISKEILNSAKLLKTVNLNAIITGNVGVGKKTLASYILPNSKIYNAKLLQQDIQNRTLILHDEAIIVDKIDEITNINLFLNWLETNNIRTIAITNKDALNQRLKDIFSVSLEIPDLEKREFDTKSLIKKFSFEASKTLDMEMISSSKLIINITKNTHSLKKSIYFSYLFETIGKEEILIFLEKYFKENLEEKDTYKNLLYLFEVPLIKVLTKKYKSQVKVAKNLGLNRITLRKKLETHKDLL